MAGFAVLAARGFLYTLSDNSYWLVSVQLLDGVGAGVFGALFPLVVQDVTHGTGRFNVSLGAVTVATGAGAAVSNLVAGSIVVAAGYKRRLRVLGRSGRGRVRVVSGRDAGNGGGQTRRRRRPSGGGHGMNDGWVTRKT